MVVNDHVGVRELMLGPLQEQHLFLNTELSQAQQMTFS